MQRYKCHKIVEAGLIDYFDGPAVILAGGEKVALSPQDHERIGKMVKDGGGYLVRYDEGYLSWSPKKVFEDGYAIYEESEAMDGEAR
jgi:hypothetical protein